MATTQRLQSAVRDEHIDPSIRGEDEQFQKQYQQYVQHQQPPSAQPQLQLGTGRPSGSPSPPRVQEDRNDEDLGRQTNQDPTPLIEPAEPITTEAKSSTPPTPAPAADEEAANP